MVPLVVRNSVKILRYYPQLLTSVLRLIQLAESKGAVIITADYRLIPEGRGVDVSKVVED